MARWNAPRSGVSRRATRGARSIGPAKTATRSALAAVTVLALAAPPAAAGAAPADQTPGELPAAIDSRVQVAAEQARRQHQPLRVLVVLAQGGEPARYAGDRRRVVAELRQAARTDQSALAADLAARSPALSGARIVNRFWIQNMVLVELDEASDAQLRALASVPGVDRLIPNFEVTAIEPARPDGAAGTAVGTDRSWGVDRIEAHRVHDELGIDGSGVRVATLDTGVDISHPDLAGKMVTDDPTDPRFPGGWMEFDSAGRLVPSEPHDTRDHGTHVSGTIHGGNASGVSIGVAPGAQLVHGLVLPGGNGTFAQVAAGMQWAIAPTDAAGGPAGRPADVINMSLGFDGLSQEMITPVRHVRLAGTFPAVAVGNGCPPGGTHSPGNVYDAVGVGATDRDDDVADFSCGAVVDAADWSDPPADWPDSYLKPDLSAPGVDVHSAEPGGGYQRLSGTSMATPHVAGAAALMLDAEPDLGVDQLLEQLADTTFWDERYGSERPNPRFGAGRINAYQAVSLIGVTGGIAGSVTDAATGASIAHATVEDATTGMRRVADADGRYTMRLPSGTRTIIVRAFGYEPDTADVIVEDGTFTPHDPALSPLPVGTITGTVTLDGDHGIPGVAEPGEGIPGVTITVENTPLTATTEADGTYVIPGVPFGTYHVTASSRIFPDSPTEPITVNVDDPAVVDFSFDAPPLIPVTGSRNFDSPVGVPDVANLDAGLFVAGHTRWDHDGDGVIFNETFAGQLWTPLAGNRMFDLSDDLYWTPSIYLPTAIADNETVAGTTNFRATFTTAPWLWAPDSGLEYLPMPDGLWTGAAVAISRNGGVIAGTRCRWPIRPRPCGVSAGAESRAVTWENGIATELPTAEPFAEARDLDDSGNVVVGAAGGARGTVQATRWVDGVEQPLERVGTSSVARFTSADGSIAMGTAVMADGAVALVRWGPDGQAAVVGPPEGMSLVDDRTGFPSGLESLSPDGSTAVGSVADGPGDPQFRDWAPFVWSERDGFMILPEAEPTEAYDRSRAVDVSDDGRVVLGEFSQSVRGPGSPPNLGFVWTRNAGLMLINDLMAEAGIENPDFWDVVELSGDGRWLNVRGSGHPDASVLLLWLDACPDGFSPNGTVVFGEEDSGVANHDWGDGCTFLDAVSASEPYDDHGQFVQAVRSRTAQWREDGLLTRQESGAILAAAARSDIGRPGGPS